MFFQAINECDSIMTFANRGNQEDMQWTQVYWFDTNELPRADEDAVLSSHLWIYKKEAAVGGCSLFNIKVFQLVEGHTTDNQLLDSRTLSYSDEGMVVQ